MKTAFIELGNELRLSLGDWQWDRHQPSATRTHLHTATANDEQQQARFHFDSQLASERTAKPASDIGGRGLDVSTYL
jgi:hypothetical protein